MQRIQGNDLFCMVRTSSQTSKAAFLLFSRYNFFYFFKININIRKAGISGNKGRASYDQEHLCEAIDIQKRAFYFCFKKNKKDITSKLFIYSLCV